MNLSPSSANGTATLGFGMATAISNNVTAILTGGVAPYSYSWEYVSGDSEPILNVLSNGTACWYWSYSIEGVKSALWKCVVTDAIGSIAESPSFTVNLEILI